MAASPSQRAWASSIAVRRVDVDAVARIAALDDPVVRNLRITQTYHDLALAMAGLLGWRNVSWCCFGTWASRTAGRFIRGEAVPRVVRRMATFAERVPMPLRALNPAGPILAIRKVAEHVAYGNRIVFADLGPLYARMVEACTASADRDSAAAQVKETLRPGPVSMGGEDLLAGAVDSYRDAMFATDPDAKAELILLANLRIGLHEQIRLQEPIAHALRSAPFYQFAPAPLRDALALVVCEHGADRLGRCRAAGCDRVYADVQRGPRRRYCSRAGQNRSSVAAFRARRAC